ncbi:hypothetical protein B0H11DRAFT_1714980 [Mycena galericulata]|nr:hypothetical protein B0H11DRAFT_1714980 [Mycena galericulata]
MQKIWIGCRRAIKRISPFVNPLLCLKALRELKPLFFHTHENILSILDVLRPSSFDSFTELYLVQELMKMDLHSIIQTRDLILTDGHRQVCSCHPFSIVYMDLTPARRKCLS